ncbi:FtsK/SpoIIIE domain-containing protein [Microbacterium sp. H1-D42]|uniref:FtsK/SpoIIIE domain-containing protein n=1 Tax=Microbacterium sp. H1-D42 TaxID=2925844 RepID=UPI001F536BFB|nr:FtsK/SpoIIIE domain-containing protein [Microbacterium sp. H1-D42]UNK69602.1 cell division protein FtsK [Microbacterium sp. H1-D42]
MDATTIVLPSGPAPVRRPPLPLLAAIVPVIAGVVLWLVTGSLFALCFAALGPLMLIASFFDGLRSRGKEHRRAKAEADAAWQRADAELERLHLEEHTDAWRREPDAAGCLLEPPLRGHAGIDGDTPIVIGRGTTRSRVRATGGDDDRSRAFRAQAEHLDDAPVSVAIGGGVCVRAPEPVAVAVVRALVAQLCLRFGPAQLALSGDGVSSWGLESFPHAGRRRADFRLRVGEGEQADAVICIRKPGEEPPDGITTVLDFTNPAAAKARRPQGSAELSVEALSAQQTQTIGAGIADKSADESSVPDRIMLDELAPADRVGLRASLGRGERGDLALDLVEDGPHAIVTGMTGTGKSELLTSWVAGIAAVHPPDEVAFVLIDFKGGTAFDPLRVLPHVVAVVTDLDADGARRGVGSLTAELRRRETALAEAGVRDVRECPSLARLVIVVDEFAALLQEHPDLGAVFTDVAARGRALGMHLMLGTQRASGVIRDALAANCPLRISLRVAEAADSRFVIGSDAAAELPGGVESRGLAFVRRPRDSEAHLARIALTDTTDLRATAAAWGGHIAPASPWLPPLPTLLELPESALGHVAAVLGLADEPVRQRQPWVTLERGDGLAIVGGPGAGKSTTLRMLAAQLPDAVVVPADPEGAWDVVAELAAGGSARTGVVLCDDLDVLAAAYPPDYAQLFLSRWERIVRRPEGAVIALSRVSGPVGRLIDAVPHRALLRMSSKVEHIAAGGEPAAFERTRPVGRAWMAGREVQFCVPSDLDVSHGAAAPEPPAWRATQRVSGVVTGAVEATCTVLASGHPTHRVRTLAETDGSLQDPSDHGAPTIIVGDPEEWRARWSLLQNVRTGGELVVAAEHSPELRQLAGVRDLPPFARLHADRAWAVVAGRMPRRVLLG